MSDITRKARELVRRVIWQGWPESSHPEAEQIIVDDEDVALADSLVITALNVVDAVIQKEGIAYRCSICGHASLDPEGPKLHNPDCPVAAFKKEVGDD
jgi:hypothetical protein